MYCSPDFTNQLAKLSIPIASQTELQKYLFLKASYPTLYLSPGGIIDRLWHKLLLFPCLYANICSLLPGGKLIDHDPTKEDDSEQAKTARYSQTLELYKTHFGTPPPDYWARIHLLVSKDDKGEEEKDDEEEEEEEEDGEEEEEEEEDDEEE